jgi:opacity protein-like surface antigen
MKLWIGGAVATMLVGLPCAAAAQDKDSEWTGVYVGVEAGGASSRQRTTTTDNINQLSNIAVPGRGLVVVPATSTSASGGDGKTSLVYGGLIGAQWESRGVIFGIEGDVHGPRNFSGFSSGPVAIPPTILAPGSTGTIGRDARMSYDWSVRVKLGAVVAPKTMLYVSGGLAGARLRLTGQDSFTTPAGAAPTSGNIAAFVSPTIGPVVIAASQRRSVLGWTAGLGGETKISKSVGIGLDARYTDYGTHDFTLAAGCNVATVAAGTCAGATRTAPAITINNVLLNPATDVTPGMVPGTTRAGFRDIRLTARLVFHF